MVRLSALGDVLHALPVLAGLKALVPGARVDWAVEDRSAPLLEGHPDLGRVIALPRAALRAGFAGFPRPWRSLRPAVTFVRALREVAYDLTLDLQGNLKSALVARASGARRVVGPDRAHTREGHHLLVRSSVRIAPGRRHKVEAHLALLASLLGRSPPPAPPHLGLTEGDVRGARGALAQAGLPERGFLVLHPGTSGFGAFKRWPPDRYGALARRLADARLPAAVTFGPGERALADAVVRAAGGAAVALETASLRTLAAVLAAARLVVAGDTGPLHLAAALGTPVLGLYGPKDPVVYGPYGQRRDGSLGLLPVVVTTDVACRPCTLRRCDAPLCLSTLAPDAVAAVAAGLQR